MKHPDENPLLKVILADEQLAALRRASLDQGLDAMRRARRVRRAMRMGALMLVPVLLILTFTLRKPSQESASQPPPPSPQQASLTPASPKESDPRMISDEELFALFPGRSLALIGKPGHQQLVLLDAQTSH
jgi:hypothetical protein